MNSEVTFRSGDGVWALPHGMTVPEFGIVVDVVTDPGVLLVTTADDHVSYNILLPWGIRHVLAHRVFATREEAVAWGSRRLV